MGVNIANTMANTTDNQNRLLYGEAKCMILRRRLKSSRLLDVVEDTEGFENLKLIHLPFSHRNTITLYKYRSQVLIGRDIVIKFFSRGRILAKSD